MRNFRLIIAGLAMLLIASCANEVKDEVKDPIKKGNFEVKANVVENAVFKDAKALVENAKKGITEMSCSDFKAILDKEEEFLLIDLRSKGDFDKGFVAGAVNIPRGVLEFRIAKESFWEGEMIYMPKKTDQIILNCKRGDRSTLAAQTLKSLGYTNVKSLKGGFKKWKGLYPENTNRNVEGPAKGSEAEEEEDDGGC